MKAKAIKCAVISAVMIAMASAVTLNAQSAAQIQFPYRCSFEDPAENANWVLNSPNQTDMCHDRWYIGQATFTDGLNSLYISCDDGNTVSLGSADGKFAQLDSAQSVYAFSAASAGMIISGTGAAAISAFVYSWEGL